MKKTKRRGDASYKKAGLSKPILIHVEETTHAKLIKHAKSEGRSLQVTARRVLEEYVKSKKL